MASQRIILLSVGSFNPPTIMHLRLFDLAKDYLTKHTRFEVVGGIISPVHDDYKKKDLTESKHRIEMVNKSLYNHPWVKCSTWEATMNTKWTRTVDVLNYHQEKLDGFMKGLNKDPWIPETLQKLDGSSNVKLKLLCGADVLESFNIPNLWQSKDMHKIAGDYGIVVISRDGVDPRNSIYNSDILTKHQGNIILIKEPIQNDISSTKMRIGIRRNEPIRYFVLDSVIEYIKQERLYIKSDLNDD